MTNLIRPHSILRYAKLHPGTTFKQYGQYVASVKGYTYYEVTSKGLNQTRIPFWQQLFAIFKHIFNIK